MKRTAVACLLSSIFAMGCAIGAPEFEGSEDIGKAEDAVVAGNAIIPNAIIPNAIIPNAIIPNAIIPNALDYTSLSQASKNSLSDSGPAGELSRMFLRYAVSCAFTSSQSFSFSWIDSNEVVHNENYVGAIGLAPQWYTGPLGSIEQEWVSACLAARTNYYGVSVLISMRGPNAALATTVAEEAQFSKLEGAFWGNIFQDPPTLSACHLEANIDSSINSQRICATGLSDGSTITSCGIINIVGECNMDSLCTGRDRDSDPFTQCGGSGHVITAFLQ